MASNVRDIKDSLKAQTTAQIKTSYYTSMANGDTDGAKKALLHLIFAELMEKDYTERERYHLFEQKKERYLHFFQRLGAEYPTNPFNSQPA